MLLVSVFFFMIPRPPRSTLFPTRRSSDLGGARGGVRPRRRALARAPRKAGAGGRSRAPRARAPGAGGGGLSARVDRKSTRLNSSHRTISYAVFCLKKKNKQQSTRYSYNNR